MSSTNAKDKLSPHGVGPETAKERKRRMDRDRLAEKRKNPVFRLAEKEKDVAAKNARYANDKEYRENKLAAKKANYANDEELREKHLAVQKARYANDEEYRTRIKQTTMGKEKIIRPNYSMPDSEFHTRCVLVEVAWGILKDEKSNLDFKEYLHRLPLTQLLKKFPQFVDEQFLRNKKYCVYVDTLYDWPELRTKNLSEVEDFVREHSDDRTRTQYEYVGKHSNGLCSRPGHKWDPNSAIYQFLEKYENSRAFNSHIFDCNPQEGFHSLTGDKLRTAIAQAECKMNDLEAFLIHFCRNKKNGQTGMRHKLINKKPEPLSQKLQMDAENLAKKAQLFHYIGPKPLSNYGYIFNGAVTFRLKEEIKIKKENITVIS